MPDLTHRNLEPELMDDPQLDPQLHRQALAGLQRLNRASGSVRILWPAIREAARALKRPIRILDVASGGGDVAIGVAKRARRAGVKAEILGLDVSQTAVEYAQNHARRKQAQVAFDRCDVLTGELHSGFDVVMCSLFLHHLSSDQALHLLLKMAGCATHVALVNDLRRSTGGYRLAQAACRCLSLSPVVHVDGPRSVAGAFTIDEIRELCRAAGLRNYEIKPRWPFRFLLTVNV